MVREWRISFSALSLFHRKSSRMCRQRKTTSDGPICCVAFRRRPFVLTCWEGYALALLALAVVGTWYARPPLTLTNNEVDTSIERLSLAKRDLTRVLFLVNWTSLSVLPRVTVDIHSAGDVDRRARLIPWKRVHDKISMREMYAEDDADIHRLQTWLRSAKIVDVDEFLEGTQLKLILYFSKGCKAIFKPKRFPRALSRTWPSHFKHSDFERHFAEIAAFQLDRAIGFRKMLPVVGRVLDFEHEVLPLLPENYVQKHVFEGPRSNMCLSGECALYCNRENAICADVRLRAPSPSNVERYNASLRHNWDDVALTGLEGALISYMPEEWQLSRDEFDHPWEQPDDKVRLREWQTDAAYCSRLEGTASYGGPHRLFELVEVAIFDFLTGNLDRHSYQVFSRFGAASFIAVYDNGKGFGSSDEDSPLLLQPLRQCCRVRPKVIRTFLHFAFSGNPLSRDVRFLLERERIEMNRATMAKMNHNQGEQAQEDMELQEQVVLEESHLRALDRRVKKIVEAIHLCFLERRLKLE